MHNYRLTSLFAGCKIDKGIITIPKDYLSDQEIKAASYYISKREDGSYQLPSDKVNDFFKTIKDAAPVGNTNSLSV